MSNIIIKFKIGCINIFFSGVGAGPGDVRIIMPSEKQQ